MQIQESHQKKIGLAMQKLKKKLLLAGIIIIQCLIYIRIGKKNLVFIRKLLITKSSLGFLVDIINTLYAKST